MHVKVTAIRFETKSETAVNVSGYTPTKNNAINCTKASFKFVEVNNPLGRSGR